MSKSKFKEDAVGFVGFVSMEYTEHINVLLEISESKLPIRSTSTSLLLEVTKEADSWSASGF